MPTNGDGGVLLAGVIGLKGDGCVLPLLAAQLLWICAGVASSALWLCELEKMTRRVFRT